MLLPVSATELRCLQLCSQLAALSSDVPGKQVQRLTQDLCRKMKPNAEHHFRFGEYPWIPTPGLQSLIELPAQQRCWGNLVQQRRYPPTVAQQLKLQFHSYNCLLSAIKPTTSAGDGNGRQKVPGSTFRTRIYNGFLSGF